MASLYVFGVYVSKLVSAVLETGQLRYSRDSFNWFDGFGSRLVLQIAIGSSSSVLGTSICVCS